MDGFLKDKYMEYFFMSSPCSSRDVGGARKEPITAVRGTKYGTIGSFKQQKKYPLNVLSVTLTRNSYRGPPIMLIRRKIRLSEARRNVLR